MPIAINLIPVAINQDIKALTPIESILPKFLAYFFYTFNKSILRLITKHSTTVQSVNTEELNKLKIPIPPINEQEAIIEILDQANKLKLKKESEARKLLADIDVYLLGELGISIPSKDNSLQNRISTTSFREVTGGRFDPKLYGNTTVQLKHALQKADPKKFKTLPLKSFIIQSISGDWGVDENEKFEDSYEKCLVIRATEFDNDFNLKLDNKRIKYRFIKKDKLKKIDIAINDLLIEKSGGSPDQPVGRISILTKEILNNNTICYSNFIHKIRVNSAQINPEYLFCYLKTIHNVKLTESMQSQTNGIRNLIMAAYYNQDIVLPISSTGAFDLSKQRQIAIHIEGMRAKAMRLRKEAQQILVNAKQQVEKMILE